jgi:hypothetical protein
MANYKGIWRGTKAATGNSDSGRGHDQSEADWSDGGSDSDGLLDGQGGASHGQSQDITDEEVSEIGNLMNDEDDPEGWMSELVDYWEQLPPTSSLTRKEWLQHRLEAARATLAAYSRGDGLSWPTRSRSKRSGQLNDEPDAHEPQEANSPAMSVESGEQKAPSNTGVADGGPSTGGLAHA